MHQLDKFKRSSERFREQILRRGLPDAVDALTGSGRLPLASRLGALRLESTVREALSSRGKGISRSARPCLLSFASQLSPILPSRPRPEKQVPGHVPML